MPGTNEFPSQQATSIPTLTLYHCGVNTTPPFWPLTHFGTLAAAKDILIRRIKKHPLEVVTIFEVCVREPSSPFRLPDFGSPNMLMLLLKLTANQNDESREFNALKPVLLSFYEDGNGRTEQGKSTKEILAARGFIRDLMLRKGYGAIVYENDQEDPGSLSYVIASNEEILACREFSRSEIERLLLE